MSISAPQATSLHPATARPAAWWARVPFVLALLATIALVVAFPVRQALATHGLIFYENGVDETSYLNYEFSRLTQSLTRPGQFLVTTAHDAGLSGGWINLGLDVTAVLGVVLLVRAILRRVGWTPGQAELGALSLVLLPQAVLVSNPIAARASAWLVHHGLLAWVNVPVTYQSPFLRSPEPQLSLLLLSLGVWAALRLKRFWPVYAVLPVMYPFVAIPAAFTLLACHLRARWPLGRFATAGPLLASALAAMSACAAYYLFLIPAATKSLVVSSHAPLLSVTSAVALILYVGLRGAIAPEHRFFALAVAFAPMLASNQQLLSGVVPQPSNFEHYLGCVAAAVVAVLALRTRRVAGLVAFAVGLAFFAASSRLTFQMNQFATQRLALTPELLSALKADAPDVVVNNVYLASALGLVYPRQRSTALGLERAWVSMPRRYVTDYRQVKGQVLAEHPAGFERAFQLLDEAYGYGGQLYYLVNISRRDRLVRLNDVEPIAPTPATRRPLKYFLVDDKTFRR